MRRTKRDPGRSNWRTPAWLIAAISATYGEIDIDAAASPGCAIANVWFGPGSPFCVDAIAEERGWLRVWQGYGNHLNTLHPPRPHVFCNPPFSRMREFIIRALNERTEIDSTMIVKVPRGAKTGCDILYDNATETGPVIPYPHFIAPEGVKASSPSSTVFLLRIEQKGPYPCRYRTFDFREFQVR